ncbi:MAG TPA: MerR family transcriptional regulator [Ruminococcus sp.]|nr:MerR family transcriptional regulator [Ruminococcus sp.]
MVYTVGEMAKIIGVAPSTLRYYDKEGLLPFVERSGSGIRIFGEQDLNTLSIIHCLKQSGLSIKEIKSFIDMVQQGDETIDERLELFEKRRIILEKQIKEMQNTLKVLDYKCWYYQTAKKEGSTEAVDKMPLSKMPKDIAETKKNFKNFFN